MHQVRQIIALMLNLPWTIVGLLAAVLSIPTGIGWSSDPIAIVINVRSFWWYAWVPSLHGVRALTDGHVILLGPHLLPHDLEHERIHVRQAIRLPFVFPFLNASQNFTNGYRHNKYEVEAYTKSDSQYLERQPIK